VSERLIFIGETLFFYLLFCYAFLCMKKRIFGAFFALAISVFAMPAFAETINAFHVDATLKSNRLLTVTETIHYDFGDASRHGLFRLIPERYARNGATYRLWLHILDATMDGNPVQTQVSHEANNIKVRIGNPKILVTGKHVYTITYETNRAINDFPDEGESELYWNITGNGWSVPIEKASTTFTGPNHSKAICFTGFTRSQWQDCTITDGESQTIQVEATRALAAGEGLTLAIRFPAANMQPVSLWQKIVNFLFDNIWAFIPVIVLIGMFSLWWRFGKEPKGTGTIIAQYEAPEGLTPGLMAAMLDQRVSLQAITATILDLGRRKFLKVVFEDEEADKTHWFKKKPKFVLKKLREPEGLLPYEQEIFDGLFAKEDKVDIAEANYQLAAAITKARKKIFEELRDKDLFGKNPSLVRGLWFVWPGIAIFMAFPFFLDVYGPLALLALIISGAIIAGFGWNMPRMTQKGAFMREKIEGFKLYLSVAEKNRIAFHNAPEKRPEQFGELLPAAIAFSVEERWAKHFEGLDVHPSYLEGRTQNWSALSYVGMVGSFHQASTSTMYRAQSSAGSGGSGFSSGGSGGGFGGGGGGSW